MSASVIVPVMPWIFPGAGQFSITANGAAVDVLVGVNGWFDPTTSVTGYAYDADGLRTAKLFLGFLPNAFSWDRSGSMPMLLSERNFLYERRYIYGPGGLPVADITNTAGQANYGVRYYHHDQLGSTRMLTDSTGSSLGAWTYTAWGQTTPDSDPTGTALGYAGQYTDSETGFQYLRARYHDPATGQFLNRDPLESLTREPYQYAGSNPINRTDPTGMSWYDPRDWDQDVVGFVEDVGERAVDVTVATVNAPVTATSAAINSWTGGDCDWNPHLTVVCYGGAISGLSDRTFVTGSTINTTMSKVDFATANNGHLLRHETWHTRQWAIFGGGFGFPTFYGLETLRTGGDECRNVFERWAGLEDGGYECGC